MPKVKKNTKARPTLTARGLMTRPVEFVSADSTMEKVSALFVRRKIGIAPVLGRAGDAVGVITKSDITRYEARRRRVETRFEVEAVANTVGAWMTPTIVAVSPEAPASAVADKMMRSHIHHVFVREPESGKIRGVISSLDFVRRFRSLRLG